MKENKNIYNIFKKIPVSKKDLSMKMKSIFKQ